MSWSVLARVLFTAVVGYAGYQLEPFPIGALANTSLGLLSGAAIVLLELYLRDLSITCLLGALLGGVVGLVTAKSIGAALYWADHGDHRVVFLHSVMLLALPYLGLVLGAKNSAWLHPEKLASLFRGAAPKRSYRVLDTSVVIDGRIADLVETNVLDNQLIMPRFVLAELQSIADSGDKLRRARGRRGLDILNRLRNNEDIDLKIYDRELPEMDDQPVDMKLVLLAKHLEGKIVTGDYNLNKVARLHNVDVINLNDIANSLKPVFLPGESFDVRIVKPGEEAGQGIGYLDDGTMIVVEGGKEFISRMVKVSVTSVLQTSAGRMIFGKFITTA